MHNKAIKRDKVLRTSPLILALRRSMKFSAIYLGSRNLSKELADDLAVDERVLLALQDDDDWSFIVKSQAIIESILTKKLSTHLDNEKLEKHLDKLSLNGASGKLNLALDLGLINKDTSKLCELFSKRLPPESRKNLQRKVPELEFSDKDGGQTDLAKKLLESPREAIFMCLVLFIGNTVPRRAP